MLGQQFMTLFLAVLG